MTEIIDGKKISDEITAELRLNISSSAVTPRLAVVVINPDSRSKKYVQLKISKASELGMRVDIYDWSGIDFEICEDKMNELAIDNKVHGIIVQLPANGLPDVQKLLDLIPVQKDVDGLSSASLEAIKKDSSFFTPATPRAIIELLKRSGVDLEGKKILIVGQGKLVGGPLAIILKNKGFNVETADDNTANLGEICKNADVVISAVGKANLINASMIKPGAVVIDAGISEAKGRMTGDVDYEGMDGLASKIARVPGGVGPVTVICLLDNLLLSAQHQL